MTSGFPRVKKTGYLAPVVEVNWQTWQTLQRPGLLTASLSLSLSLSPENKSFLVEGDLTPSTLLPLSVSCVEVL